MLTRGVQEMSQHIKMLGRAVTTLLDRASRGRQERLMRLAEQGYALGYAKGLRDAPRAHQQWQDDEDEVVRMVERGRGTDQSVSLPRSATWPPDGRRAGSMPLPVVGSDTRCGAMAYHGYVAEPPCLHLARYRLVFNNHTQPDSPAITVLVCTDHVATALDTTTQQSRRVFVERIPR
jgi:hypothetical protein